MLYYLHHLSGYVPILNVTRYITFRTAAASLTALAARHEILRTTLASVDGRPWQVIAAAHAVMLPITEIAEGSVPAALRAEMESANMSAVLIGPTSSLLPIPTEIAAEHRMYVPLAAVVAVVKRCRASRFACALRSIAARSTAGRHVDVTTVGIAKTASSTRAAWTDASSAMVMPRRRIQPHVENSDMYM